MSLTGISSSVSMMHASQAAARPDPIQRPTAMADAQGPGFAERLGKAVESVNTQQSKASQAARDFETGRTENLAAVMVEQQVASLGFQMTMQVRNKALTAYRDIMNMPV
ncbi:Flagellar hook-basal body complex protein FliE [Roseovarius sp. EC-HK134]|jgi:flagellar hook-basal body complex protein FliE|uniref:Flagellar hook-basal body complex protein FliE n=1 Tax=Roseovarius mucosus TaxID=215743 RepID=A0A1V0RSD0_9RHOB|nr:MULTISPECIES: flagellar hook-basal body complex protein FliE [Roseovarius]ARE84651.1 flagellar hook-basal body complex protein FliE [Roseovarius mucosus]AWZ20792.1 Flagellar hook-basal body complex protein FliE [Roseovarius sp. AK1035]EDM32671.1 flagellar protein FliE [Roseovarius sp. TM1035]MBW4973936.1 flagellar hook-basal body complex protein FliE [Roseovarius mucosus]VVT20448.1 Flagellar hook-basal body complex protein FliE [Roseovarius sp. EC-SD190]|tara:strand:+ start:501 stop:827 length:327 start_codon:yes stop_codon:yes gene_type:complete